MNQKHSVIQTLKFVPKVLTLDIVYGTLILKEQGVDLSARCGSALERIVDFAYLDLQSGKMSEAITGKTQSMFDGITELKNYQMAWIEAYLQMDSASELLAYARANQDRQI